MANSEFSLIATFSNSVRNSTLKRLVKVPEGSENWSPVPGALSFADLAYHIVQCDVALLRAEETREIEKNLGTAGVAQIGKRKEYEALLSRLRDLKSERFKFIMALDSNKMNILVEAERIRGTEHIPLGGLLMETLDHEVHHRGQVSTYLRLFQEQHAAAE